MKKIGNRLLFAAACLILFALFVVARDINTKSQEQNESYNIAFDQAANEFHVPKELLETICYTEGNMSNHNGYPSVDNGYGCMHLAKNDYTDTLDEAAALLHVPTNRLKTNTTDNIRGGAAILRNEALKQSMDHKLPANLNEWYGAVAAYSYATNKQSSVIYADNIFKILNNGFSITSDTEELVKLAPHKISPDKSRVNGLTFAQSLPEGCVNDGNTDYPGAIDCILDPKKYNCNFVPDDDPCTYEEADRPNDFPITFIAIHYFEAYLPSALSLFHDPKSLVSIHYIVDTDGTVYQIAPEKDIAYHLGNYWYNQRSIGIEHTGFGPGGYRWFNAAEYLGSARLTAYLAKKYNIPLDHDHIVAHGTVPASTLDTSPNHVDPGQYWQWDTYFDLIHQQGVSYPKVRYTDNTINIHPQINLSDSYFYLYANPATGSQLIPSAALVTDRIDESDNIEADVSYAYRNTTLDLADPNKNLYQIWYGENDNITQNNPLFLINGIIYLPSGTTNWFANAKLVWLAVPKEDVGAGTGTIVKLISPNQTPVAVYAMPVNDEKYVIGNAPKGAIFVSAFTERETETNTLWYEINYNHRQAWIPSSEALSY